MSWPVTRDGLWESAQDFGADIHSEGFDLGDEIAPSVSVGDLTLSLRPAIRARAHSRILLAGAVGTISGFAIQADVTGFWVRTIYNSTGQGILVAVEPGPGISLTNEYTWATPIPFNVYGDAPGEARGGNLFPGAGGPGPYIRDARMGNNGALVPPHAAGSSGFQLTNAIDPSGLFPLWIPGNMVFTAWAPAANTAIDISVAVQFCANNVGRFP